MGYCISKKNPVLTVENTYKEVDMVELDRLFDRFYRADKARSYTGSFGIGLSIASAIAKNHHGDIVNTLEKHQIAPSQRKGRKRGQNEDNVSTRPKNSQ